MKSKIIKDVNIKYKSNILLYIIYNNIIYYILKYNILNIKYKYLRTKSWKLYVQSMDKEKFLNQDRKFWSHKEKYLDNIFLNKLLSCKEYHI